MKSRLHATRTGPVHSSGDRPKLIAASDKFRSEHERQLVATLQERLGCEVTIEVRVVDDIPCESSGKFRWEISRVKHDCRLPWAQRADATGDSDHPPRRLHVWRAPKS